MHHLHVTPAHEDRDPAPQPMSRVDFYTSLLFLAVAFGSLGTACVVAIFSR